MHAVDLGARGIGLCEKLKELRNNCKNLSGTYRGLFRDTTQHLEDSVRAFIEKIQTAGDVAYLKQVIYERTEELKSSKRNEEALRKEVEELRAMVSNLRKEVNGLKV